MGWGSDESGRGRLNSRDAVLVGPAVSCSVGAGLMDSCPCGQAL